MYIHILFNFKHCSSLSIHFPQASFCLNIAANITLKSKFTPKNDVEKKFAY